jgi:hypothetical protein
MALPGGRGLVGRSLHRRTRRLRRSVGFVLAHEMAPSVRNNARQALSSVRLPRPRQRARGVHRHRLALLESMAPVLHPGGFDADEQGLPLAQRLLTAATR